MFDSAVIESAHCENFTSEAELQLGWGDAQLVLDHCLQILNAGVGLNINSYVFVSISSIP